MAVCLTDRFVPAFSRAGLDLITSVHLVQPGVHAGCRIPAAVYPEFSVRNYRRFLTDQQRRTCQKNGLPGTLPGEGLHSDPAGSHAGVRADEPDPEKCGSGESGAHADRYSRGGPGGGAERTGTASPRIKPHY
nr:hypothetical protein [Mucilaginibacter robiniae]